MLLFHILLVTVGGVVVIHQRLVPVTLLIRSQV